MLYLAAKALLSGLIIAAASEIAKRSPAFGALILSLPLLSILSRPVLPAHGYPLRRDGVGPRPVRCHALEGVLCQRGRRRPTHQSQSVMP